MRKNMCWLGWPEDRPILLTAGASTQSRARRPNPWPGARVVNRSATRETWELPSGKYMNMLTWVFDQGGPVLGYTCRTNALTRRILDRVVVEEGNGMFGPGSIVSALEVEAAHALVDAVGGVFPGGSLGVRFFQNGSDACDAAVRVARAATGRKRYASIGYHGSSQLFATEPQCGGILKGAVDGRTMVEFGDMMALAAAVTQETACVIVEVPSIDEVAATFLLQVKDACDFLGALFILDEVVTGFRLSFTGAAGHYGVTPDLACYGKAMSNGRPVAALVGNRRVMDALVNDAFYSCTMNGDPQGMAHVLGTLQALRGMDYRCLWTTGEKLRSAMAGVGVQVIGHAPRTVSQIGPEVKKGMIQAGVVMDQPNYATFAHTQEDIEDTAAAAEIALDHLQSEF